MKTNILTTQILQQKFVNNIFFVIEIKALDLKKQLVINNKAHIIGKQN